MKEQKIKEKGITLIALVVTIVVLLILASVSIGLLAGENGIINQAKESKERTIIGEEKEYIKLAYQNAEMQLKMNGEEITAEGIEKELKKYNEKVSVKEIEESEIGDLEIVVDKENAIGYVEITYEETTHIYVVAITKKTTTTPSETSNITFTYNPPLNEWTNGEVSVTASTELTGYTIKMSTDGTDWDETNSLTYTDNGKVYAKLVKDTEELEIEEGEVINIDKTPPEVGVLMISEDAGSTWVNGNEDGYFEEYENCYYIDRYDEVYRTKLSDGKDFESGHKSTTYTLEINAEIYIYKGEDNEEVEPTLINYLVAENSSQEINVGECFRSLEDYAYEHYYSGNVSNIDFLPYDCKITITTEDNVGNKSTVSYSIAIIYA